MTSGVEGEAVGEMPLHVQVAEALGWTRVHYRMEGETARHGCGDIMLPDPERMRWKGRKPDEMLIGADCNTIPRYDTDWSATGPLIEKFKIDVGYEGDDTRTWTACVNHPDGLSWEDAIGAGATPLMAVCELILALKAAGKLEATA